MDDLTIKRIIREIDKQIERLESEKNSAKQIIEDLKNLQLRKEEINLPFSQK